MTYEENRATLEECVRAKRFCVVRNLQETEERYLLPLGMGPEFYLSAVENGLATDGYLLDRLDTVDQVLPAGEDSAALVRRLHITEKVAVPDMDLTAANRIFAWLISAGGAVSLECVHPGSRAVEFFLCVITDCREDSFDIRRFEPSCHWVGGIMTIPYATVRRLLFGTVILKKYTQVLRPKPKK